MEDVENTIATANRPRPWNKGKLTGSKPPLRPKHVWSIRTKLQIEGRVRDLAMFNLAIDSKQQHNKKEAKKQRKRHKRKTATKHTTQTKIATTTAPPETARRFFFPAG